MNKETFFEKFRELNPKGLWEIDGFTREGESKPAFVLKAYAINGHVIIMQDWGKDGISFYLPDMSNKWDSIFEKLEKIDNGKKIYV